MMHSIRNFTKHNNRGHSVLFSELKNWRDPATGSDVFGPVVAYSWSIDDRLISINDPKSNISLYVLPDASGFVCIERTCMPNNCLLLGMLGEERVRLYVPWQYTTSKNPKSADPPTSFSLVGDTYINPADGRPGLFGITAWVEYAGNYYFELDYHNGQFLWGREIRD